MVKENNIDDVVTVRELRKTYDTFPAVDGISFSIRKGEIFGLLGPNGAGKTTTIKVLSGLSKPSSGTVHIMGSDIVRDTLKVKRFIGVVPETSNLYPELSCFDNLLFAGRLYRMRTKEAQSKADDLLKLFGLEEKRNVSFGKLSGGMKRKLTMAASLIHGPSLLFLDEPTTGLDVMSARALREIIQSLKKKGITILLTTHYIDEADRLCDRIAIIVRGRLITIDTPEALKQSIESGKAIDMKIPALDPSVKAELYQMTIAKRIEERGELLRFYIDDIDMFLSEFFTFAKTNNVHIDAINTVTPSLEDAFVEITGLKREVMIEEKAGKTK